MLKFLGFAELPHCLVSHCHRPTSIRARAHRSTAYIASFSLFGVPLAGMAPTDLATKQWSKMFHIGMNSAPRVAVALTACFAFLTYSGESKSVAWADVLRGHLTIGHSSRCPEEVPVWRGCGIAAWHSCLYQSGDVVWHSGTRGSSPCLSLRTERERDTAAACEVECTEHASRPFRCSSSSVWCIRYVVLGQQKRVSETHETPISCPYRRAL